MAPDPERSDPEPFAGIDPDEPLIDDETWQTAGRALVATNNTRRTGATEKGNRP